MSEFIVVLIVKLGQQVKIDKAELEDQLSCETYALLSLAKNAYNYKNEGDFSEL